MTTYISLMNYTDRGIHAVRKSPQRLDAAKALLEEMGGTFRAFFLTMGQYDLVLIYEAPDDAVWGYAITAHKAQGSQYPTAVVYDDGLGRTADDRARWLYTAITRAEWGLVILD